MARQETRKPLAKGRVVTGAETLPFGKKNLILFAVGFGTILLGYFLLAQNSITLAPLLLVAGYCFIIPWAILAK